MKKTLCFLGVCVLAGRIGYSAAALDAAAAAKKFTVPENFEVNLWASEPLLANPVAFTFDSHGRAYVAETYRLNNSVFDITQNTNWLRRDIALDAVSERAEFLQMAFSADVGNLTRFSERLQLVEDQDGNGTADSGRTLGEEFNQVASGIAAGVLAHGTNLWFACIPDLWRYLDSDGDGIAERGHKLHTGYGVHIGVTGHDLHGLAMGPDGRLYFSIGDRGLNVEANGKHVYLPYSGGVLRCEPDGSNLELYATGMRNPQELAFDEFGNLFTGDNDTAGADNSRLLYVVEGGDYGWRFSYQHMTDFGPWVREKLWEGGQDGTLPHSGNPAQGPSGFVYYPGTGLPASYQGHFFMCDFPGGIWSFPVKPKGAGFEIGERKKFVWNAWPTDVEFGPDAGIYFSDWVGGWTLPGKGRIYHMRAKSGVAQTRTKELLQASFLEVPESGLTELLAFADYRVRQKAQFELARRKATDAFAKVMAGASVRARVHALWGLGQIGRADRNAVSWTGIADLFNNTEPEIRAQVASLAAELELREAVPALTRLLQDETPRVQFFAAQALARLGDPGSIPALVALVREGSSDSFLLHPIVAAVARFASAEQMDQLSRDNATPIRRIALLAMRKNQDAAIARFLSDPDLVVEAARAINDVPIVSAMEALSRIAGQSNLPEAALIRSLNANFRIGTPEAASRLGKLARNRDASEKVRSLALNMLADWSEPDAVDRIVCLWRPLPARDAKPAREQVEKCLSAVLPENSEILTLGILNAATALKADVSAAQLVQIFDDAGKGSSTRIGALRALVQLKPDASEDVLARALRAEDENVRLLACDLAVEKKMSAAVSRLAALAHSDSSLKVRQAALRALRGADGPEAHSALRFLIDQLKAGTAPESLQLELITAAESSRDPDIQARSTELHPLKFTAMLAGGNRDEGRRIFQERQDVSCMRCHAINGNGGTVGPDLTKIGGQKSREYLLKAITNPNEAIAEGYEQVILQLKNGTSVAGLVQKETAEELTLDSPEDGLLHLQKSEITQRNRNLSAMPEGLDKMLTPFELRDLVEYLATLK